MREFGHVVGFVELGWVNFVDAFRIYFSLLKMSMLAIVNSKDLLPVVTYAPIITLNKYPVAPELFNHPPLDEGLLRVLKPHISPAREVILALNPPNRIDGLPHLFCVDK